MRKLKPRRQLEVPQSRPSVETLEPRQLFAWGAFPQLIDQDLATSRYPQYTGSGQTIAFIDTGVDYTQPQLAGKYVGGYDFLDNDTDPMDTDGHGTALATLAVGGSYTYQGADYRGIAPGANIAALRVDDAQVVPDARYEAAFQWIIANRVALNITVVNCSFGGGHYTTEAQRAVYADEMATLAAVGVYIVASSGNDGAQTPYGVEYPGADPSVFNAGSVTSGDVISKFTERGPIMDILAPGENVPTAYLDANGNRIFLAASGTSFSSPIVAGAAALIKQVDPTFTARDVNSILRASGVDNYDGDAEATPRTLLTYSRLDVDSAVDLAVARRAVGAAPGTLGDDGREAAIKFDQDGVLHYAWYDSATTELKYAARSNNGKWTTVRTVDTAGDVGHFVSMAVSSTGKPSLAYYDSGNADLKYAAWTGSSWAVETVQSHLSVGLYPSLAFDQFDDPIITYYYKNGGDLRVAVNFGSGWQISTVDATQDSGRYSSLALNASGQWTVAYENSTTGQFKFARRSGTSWSVSTIDGATRAGGGYISLAYDGSNRANVSYYDAWNADLKFARLSGTTWSTTTVASQFSQGLYTNLFFDAGGSANIVYFNKTQDSALLAAGTFGNWNVSALASGGGRHLAVARYGGTSVFAFYDSASTSLALDQF
ncbi:MAG TPA: S8 family serine peptidase [Tepidisphaeraceae bacterium]|nr:S8 family serine peptidase [Tepidisphaeraceae bacterium]